MKAAKKSRKVHPAVVVLMLLGSAGVAAKSLLGLGATAPSAGSAATASAELSGNEGDAAAADTAAPGRDLLAVYGSFEKGAAVRLSFGLPADLVAAAPAVEGQLRPSVGDWRGEDPPSLALGVVMISEGSRRAVLGGKVVGIGDEVGGVTVTAIATGCVTVQWQQRRLTYDLGDDVPREFRATLSRRRERQQDSEQSQDGPETDVPAAKKEAGK